MWETETVCVAVFFRLIVDLLAEAVLDVLTSSGYILFNAVQFTSIMKF